MPERSHPSSLLLITILLVALAGCGSPEEWLLSQQAAVHTVCGGTSKVEGVDVSKWQAKISWPQVKASGKVFAIIRVSDGLTHPDAYFAANWTAAKGAGLLRGPYQFFRPEEDPIAQADLLANAIAATGGFEATDLPAVVDIEVADGQSASKIVTAVDTWLRRVKQRTNRVPMIYTGPYFWDESVSSGQLSSYPLWTAHYTTDPCPLIPNAWKAWRFWQYTSSGIVSGITGDVDLDRFNGTLAELRSFIASSIITPGTIRPDAALALDGTQPRVDTGAPPNDLAAERLLVADRPISAVGGGCDLGSASGRSPSMLALVLLLAALGLAHLRRWTLGLSGGSRTSEERSTQASAALRRRLDL